MQKKQNALVQFHCLEIFIVTVILIFSSQASAGDKRGRVIDFEDELVEGVNKRPLDSVSQISERNKRRRQMHLYRKRQGFRSETQEILTEMRVWQ